VTGPGVPYLHLSARRWLSTLHDEVGAAGLAAAAAIPGLAAAVDQHAAAVRDSTTLGLESSAAVAGVVLLASYARGVVEHGRKQGWQPAARDGHGWATADWITVRLVAVCALAGADGNRSADLPSLETPPPPVQA
jgi:hypothetical protein